MPKKELKKEEQMEILLNNLGKAMLADMKAGKNILNADARKKKTHRDYIYAKEELDAFKRDHCF